MKLSTLSSGHSFQRHCFLYRTVNDCYFLITIRLLAVAIVGLVLVLFVSRKKENKRLRQRAMLPAHAYHAPSPRPRVLGRHIAELLLSLVNKPFGVTFAVSGCSFLIIGAEY